MQTFTVSDLGAVGLIRDLKPHRLPANAFSESLNTRFFEGIVSPVAGYTDLDPLSAQTMDAIYWDQHFYSGNNDWWVVTGLASSVAKVVMFTLEGAERNITPTGGETLAISNGDQWSGGPFMGNCIICNGRSSEVFYISDPDGGAPVMQELEYSSGVGLYTRLRFDVVRPWKNYLIGIGVQVVPVGGVAGIPQGYYPNLVWWSDVAGPGEVPGSWEADNPSTHAGYQPLGNLRAELVDGIQLGDRFLLYGANTIHSMQYVGPPAVFQFHEDMISIGCMATNTVVPIELQGQPTHIVMGSGDIYATDGISVRSIVDDKLRRYIYDTIDPDFHKSSFVVAHLREDEVWCCLPTDGNQYPNMAVVYNYRTNTLYLRDLPTNTTFASWGRQTTGDAIFGVINSETAIINTVNELINARDDYQPGDQTMVSVTLSGGVFRHGQGTLFNGAAPFCYISRTGMQIEENATHPKVVTEIWPEIDADPGSTVELRIGAQDNIGASVTWEDWHSFSPGVDKFIPVTANGRLHAWELRSNDGSNWRLSAINFMWTPNGRF